MLEKFQERVTQSDFTTETQIGKQASWTVDRSNQNPFVIQACKMVHAD